MKPKTLLRPSLTIIFGFVGAYIAKSGTPPDIFAITGDYFLLIAVLAFGTFGFILPDLLELAGQAGIVALARQISKHLPDPTMGLSVPKFSLSRRKSQKSRFLNPLLLDTSVLIDGRFLEVARTGFIMGTVLVIPSVISELHQLADSANDLKRARGRLGLENISSLREIKKVKVEVLESEPKEGDVDSKLLKYAKQLRAKILTVDYNLNRVARAKKVDVLSLNELATAVKTAVLPHEQLEIHIKSPGKSRFQGVGYLDDGTMVVVEGGSSMVGKTVTVDVSRVLQTATGKMIFAKPSLKAL